MSSLQSLRQLISSDDAEVVVYAADNFSQYPTRHAGVSSKCDRALAPAHNNDLVILRSKLHRDYHQWLRSLGLSTDYIVEYQQPTTGRTLSELIIENPNPRRVI